MTTPPTPSSTSSADRVTADFRSVDSWIFDLDNTLYPSVCDLFAEIEVRMGLFISHTLGLDHDAAHALRRRYYREHGTTLRGLMTVDRIDPRQFLNFVHDVDLSLVPPNPQLGAHLAALPGRKFVFTNGTSAYAGRVLDRLGIADHFKAIFDIEAADYVPKPAPQTLDAFLMRAGVAPDRAIMFDDLLRNLEPARRKGLRTVWIRTHKDWSAGHDAGDAPNAEVAHHVTDDLTQFLGETVLGGGR